MSKRAKKEQKQSRIEQMIEEMLKEEETKRKRMKRLEELTNNIKR
jgi:iron-sulfur cluster repair protein YtfE (RIC family)